MNVKVVKRHNHANDEAHRFEHDGFLIGSTWMDCGEVVQIVGEGMAGMPEVQLDNGSTYYANPLALVPYQSLQ